MLHLNSLGSDGAAKRKARHASIKSRVFQRSRRQKLQSFLFGGGAILLVGGALYTLLRPLSPEEICHQTLDALERRDIAAVLRFTHPREMRRMHLTEKSITDMLDATILKEKAGPLSKMHIVAEPTDNTPIDRRVFSIYADRINLKSGKPILAVAVSDSTDHGWSLDLTWLLFSHCLLEGRSSAGRLKYAKLCREYGIPGMMDYSGNFLDIAEIERRANSLAALGR
jgi:hypothetical protein